MRVLFIEDRSFSGHSSDNNSLLAVARAVQRSGHSAHILACVADCSAAHFNRVLELPHAIQVIEEGVPVILLPFFEGEHSCPMADEQQTIQLCDWIQGQKFDLVHLFYPISQDVAVHAVQRCRLPLVISLTEFPSIGTLETAPDKKMPARPDHEIGKRLEFQYLCTSSANASLNIPAQQARELLSLASLRVCPSHYATERYREVFPDFDFTVVPQGLALQYFLRPANLSKPDTSGLILGCVDNDVSPRGLMTLLQALALVPDLDVRLQVLGTDHILAGEMQKLIAADHRVHLQTDLSPQGIADFFHALDLLCLPWDRIPAGMRVLDRAAAAGVPVFASELGAVGAWVTQHGCGRVLPAEECATWASALADITRSPQYLNEWRKHLPLPLRIEEETFFYQSLYRTVLK